MPLNTIQSLYKKQLRDDLARMQAGQLGLSQAEKDRIVGQTQQATGAQVAALQGDLARQTMGSQVQGVSGQAAQLQRQLAQTASDATGKGVATANQLSSQLANAERQQIMGNAAQQAALDAQRRQYILGLLTSVLNTSVQAGAQVASSGSGLMAMI